jgi:hypothetical protein
MVKLDINSPYNEKLTPFLYKWDTEYRKNHGEYQYEIDKITYHLQRAQRGIALFGSWIYPNFHQREFLLLDLYKKKQLIGRVFPEEVNAYKPINHNITNDLDKTFSTNWYVPTTGIAIGLGLNVFAHLFNFQYSFRLGLFLLPVMAEYYIRYSDASSHIRSLQFLNWLVEYRKARAQIEVDSQSVFKDKANVFQKFKSISKSTKPVKDLYEDIVKLVSSESVEEL